ncbi:MAG: enoyl-CoA hydratase-related protein, partial [Acidimicrobiia bacterium]
MTVRVERDGPVWTVIHSRPHARNAVDPASAEALYDSFVAFEADPEARVAVLWGEGGAFCAGFDLKYAGSADATTFSALGSPAEDTDRRTRGPMGPTRLLLDKPVIAAVAGPAVAGGMELA